MGRLILSSSDADGRAWAEAAAGTVGRRVGVERHRVVTFTTLRASARRTGQTAYLITAFGRIKMAHPDLLFDSLRCNRVSMSRWVVRHWLSHPRRGRPAVLVHAIWRHHAIGRAHSVWWVSTRRRRARVGSATIALEWIARRLTSASAHRRARGTRWTTSRELVEPLSSE